MALGVPPLRPTVTVDALEHLPRIKAPTRCLRCTEFGLTSRGVIMQITVNFDVLKKVGVVLFVLAGLFSLTASVSYVRFRLNSYDYFQISEVDINMRLPEIRQRYLQ